MLFRRLRGPGRGFLLESVEGGESVARYTFWASARRRGFRCATAGRASRGAGAWRPNGAGAEALKRSSASSVPTSSWRTRSCHRSHGERSATSLTTPCGSSKRSPTSTAARARSRRAVPALRRGRGVRPSEAAGAPLDHARSDPEGRSGARGIGGDRTAGSAPVPARRSGSSPEPRRVGRGRFVPAMPRERFLEAVAATREAIVEGEVYQAVCPSAGRRGWESIRSTCIGRCAHSIRPRTSISWRPARSRGSSASRVSRK